MNDTDNTILNLSFSGYSADYISRISRLIEHQCIFKRVSLSCELFRNVHIYPRNYINNTLSPAVQVGAFASSGSIINESLLFRNNQAYTKLPDFYKPHSRVCFDYIPEAVYCGLMTAHYGHMLTETCSRIWCLKDLGNNLNIIFNGEETINPIFNYILSIYTAHAINILIPKAPLLVGKLHIPTPSFVEGEYMHPLHLEPVRHHFDSCNAGQEYSVLYLSRRLIRDDPRRLVNEDLVEDLVQRSGGLVVHPQFHSIERQINFIANSKYIIAPIGSALHSLLLTTFRGSLLLLTDALPHPNFPVIDSVLMHKVKYVNCIKADGCIRVCDMSKIEQELNELL